MSSKYENILFDFDGVLVSSIDFWMDTYRESFAAFDIYPSDKEIMFHLGDWEIHQHFGVQDREKFAEIVQSKLDGMNERHVLSKEVLEMLDQLEGKHSMAIVSSAVKENITFTLEKYSIEQHFSHIFGVGEVTKYKPDPEGIFKAMEYLEASPEDTIMIGDSRKDIEAANKAGIDSILYYPPQHEKTHDLDVLKEYNPTYIVNSLLDIPEIVN